MTNFSLILIAYDHSLIAKLCQQLLETEFKGVRVPNSNHRRAVTSISCSGIRFHHIIPPSLKVPGHCVRKRERHPSRIWAELIETEGGCCTDLQVMERSITHFEICGDEPSQIAEFYGRIFGWRVERMPGVDYWRIFPPANANGPLHGGVTYRAIPGLNSWLLYVNVASLDETVDLVQELGGSVVRPKTAVPKVAWVTIVADPANNIFGVWQSDPTAFPVPMPD